MKLKHSSELNVESSPNIVSCIASSSLSHGKISEKKRGGGVVGLFWTQHGVPMQLKHSSELNVESGPNIVSCILTPTLFIFSHGKIQSKREKEV